MSIAVMSSKGQIVIPAEIRKRAALNSGDHFFVDFDEDSQELTIRKTEPINARIDKLAAEVAGWIKPGTPPLHNPREFYNKRKPRI